MFFEFNFIVLLISFNNLHIFFPSATTRVKLEEQRKDQEEEEASCMIVSLKPKRARSQK